MRGPQLSTDSFVDIVANTTGMVVILVLLSSVLNGTISDQVGQERRRLAELERRIEDLARLRQDLPDLLEQARRRASGQASAIAGLDGAWASDQDRLGELGRQRAALAAEVAELERLAGSDAVATRRRQAEVDAALAARIADASAAVQILIRSEDAASLRARLVAAERERARARGERDAAVADRAAAEAALAAARRALAEEQATLERLRQERSPEVAARGPGRQRAAGSRPIYVECLGDADGAPRIRPVTPAFFAKVPEGWRAVAEAQPMAALGDGSAPWGTLRPSAAGEPPRHLYAVVRPGGFVAYRTMRRWAAERGWWLDWDPLPAGEVIPVGASATTAVAP